MKYETLMAILAMAAVILLVAVALMMMYIVYVYSVQCWGNASMCITLDDLWRMSGQGVNFLNL